MKTLTLEDKINRLANWACIGFSLETKKEAEERKLFKKELTDLLHQAGEVAVEDLRNKFEKEFVFPDGDGNLWVEEQGYEDTGGMKEFFTNLLKEK